MDIISPFQYSLVYNAFSFTFATMAAATLFLWFGRSQVSNHYKTAVTISGFFSVDPMKMSSAAFQILSVVAAPHLVLSKFLDRQQNGERSMAVSGR